MKKNMYVIVGLLLLAGFAGAAVIWSDDFESGLTLWSDTWTGGTGTAAVEANPSGSGNVFHIKSDTASDWAAARTSSIGTTLNQSTEFHIEFDVYFPTNAWQQTFRIFAAETSAIGPDVVFRWTEDHRTSTYDYTVDVREDSGWRELTNTAISSETWTTIYIDASGDGTYRMHIGDYSNYIGTFDLRDGDWSRIFIGDGSGSSYSGEYYLDNILVTDTVVPEPATVGLLGMFSLYMFLIRRVVSH